MDTFAKLQLFTLRIGRIEFTQHHFRDLQSLPQSRRIAIQVPRDSPAASPTNSDHWSPIFHFIPAVAVKSTNDMRLVHGR